MHLGTLSARHRRVAALGQPQEHLIPAGTKPPRIWRQDVRKGSLSPLLRGNWKGPERGASKPKPRIAERSFWRGPKQQKTGAASYSVSTLYAGFVHP